MLVFAVMCAGGPIAVTTASAQDFPSKPIRIIVPYATGGQSDLSARITAKLMAEELGQSIVVENRPGASGMIGMGMVARADPDGYTLAWSGTSGLLLAPFLVSKPSYDPDPLKSFAPVGISNTGVTVLLVSPTKGHQFQSMKDLIARAKSNPGKLSYASSGISTSTHLTGALFANMAGIDVFHVPFKGGREGVTAVIGGHADFIFDALGSVLPLIKSGQVKALAVSGTTRHKSLPEVPTAAEAGLPGFATEVFVGLVAPAATPAAIINKLSGAMRKAMAKPDVREQFERIGVDPASSSPEEFRSFIANETIKWRRAIQVAGVTPE